MRIVMRFFINPRMNILNMFKNMYIISGGELQKCLQKITLWLNLQCLKGFQSKLKVATYYFSLKGKRACVLHCKA